MELLFARLHDHWVNEADAEGLSKMLEPINRLAEQASNGLNFDEENSLRNDLDLFRNQNIFLIKNNHIY